MGHASARTRVGEALDESAQLLVAQHAQPVGVHVLKLELDKGVVKPARGRLAHLLCEMALRYQRIGGHAGPAFAFPVTQAHLADLARNLRQLRRRVYQSADR